MLSHPRIRKEQHYAKTKGLHINRTSRRDCDYRIVDGHSDTGAAAGEKAGKGNSLSTQFEKLRSGGQVVLGRQ
jgi:hypothetical protein